MKKTKGYKVIKEWLASGNKKPFAFQEEAWQQIFLGNSGLVNAPTGFGKTFSVFLGALIQFINEHPDTYKTKTKTGLQLLWVTPLRALGKDIARAMEEVIAALDMSWQIGIRNGDTEMNERQRQKRNMPEALIITPESLHLLLGQKDFAATFKSLRIIAIDEWHELLGSKRGVQVELAVSRLAWMLGNQKNSLKNNAATDNIPAKKTKHSTKAAKDQPVFSLWGISATIGNLVQAKEVLLAPLKPHFLIDEGAIIKANLKKDIAIESGDTRRNGTISVGGSPWFKPGTTSRRHY